MRQTRMRPWRCHSRGSSAGANDRPFAFGAEFGVILPDQKFSFLIRVLPEFASRSRTPDVTLVVALGKSF